MLHQREAVDDTGRKKNSPRTRSSGSGTAYVQLRCASETPGNACSARVVEACVAVTKYACSARSRHANGRQLRVEALREWLVEEHTRRATIQHVSRAFPAKRALGLFQDKAKETAMY